MDPLSRRSFLRAAGAGAAGLSLASILAACERAASGTAATSTAASAPTATGALPLFEDNAAIAGDLPIEKGATLKIYQRGEYLYEDVIRSFVRRYADYDIDATVESFTSVDDAVANLGKPGSDYDVFFPSIESLRPLVAAKQLRPLNHDYLENSKFLWPQFLPPGPSYDPGMRYTTPYTIFTTGIGWRADLVDAADAPDQLDDPYSILWNPKYARGVYPSYREALGMALLRAGVADPNTATPAQLDAAAASLRELGEVAWSMDAAVDGLPDGRVAVAQAWSGDVITARRYALDEGGHEARNAKHLRYLWPERGVIGADLSAILTQGKNPVLAHAFLNHMMDMDVALENFGWNGYQPAVTCAIPAMFEPGTKWEWITGPNLVGAIASPDEWDPAAKLLPLDPSTDAAWQEAWQQVRVG